MDGRFEDYRVFVKTQFSKTDEKIQATIAELGEVAGASGGGNTDYMTMKTLKRLEEEIQKLQEK